MKKFLVLTAAILVIVAILGQSVQSQVAEGQSSDAGLVTIEWRDNGARQKASFTPPTMEYFLFIAVGATTSTGSIAWAGFPHNEPDGLIPFSADDGKLTHRTRDSRPTVFDVIDLMRQVVGLR